MPGTGVPGDHTSFNVTSTAVLANLLVGARGITAPYVVLGAGVQSLEVEHVRNPYGLTGGLRAGVGLRARVRETLAYVELIAHLNLTDHGAGDFTAGYFFPVVAGVRF